MGERICIEPGCESPLLARGRCSKHYRTALHAGSLPPRPEPVAGSHTLTDVDESTNTALCSDCGPGANIRRYGRGRRGVICKERKRYEDRQRYLRTSDRKPKAARRFPTQRQYILLRKYGLSQDDYAAMSALQAGRCAICGSTPRYPLRVDHCHVTGRVRGLLCNRCNTGLGHFADDAALLHLAADYLVAAAR